MQFHNPAILYFLLLLIIPILVHLFQLQKFVKTPFTNVAFLQKLVLETRKSSQLKKWLILCTRLLLFGALIIAFSQPYFSTNKQQKATHTFIYLDNSLSTNSKGEKGDLLQVAKQDLIENITIKGNFSLLTNNKYVKNISSSEIKKHILKITNTGKKSNFSSVLLKINSQKQTSIKDLHNNILVSDFQNNYLKEFTNVNQEISLIKLTASQNSNISIDSVFTNQTTNTGFTLNVIIRNQGAAKNNIPISISNNNTLVNKQVFSIDKNSVKTIQFTIKNQTDFFGKIQLTYNDIFSFDNQFYFTINSAQKTSVLSIGKTSQFLKKIYTKKAFNFTTSTLQNINYNNIEKQQLIIINELLEIPNSLINSLVAFVNNGGHLVVIPNSKTTINSYNNLFKKLKAGSIYQKKTGNLKITKINYSHAIFKNVFSKKITNFQYPTVKTHFPSTFTNSNSLFSFENNTPFIKQINLKKGRFYFIASPLNKENSNFTNSPLIVPAFYNFGLQSLQQSKLYYRIDQQNTIDIKATLKKSEILSIKNSKLSFIPLQERQQHKISLQTKEKPLTSGFYTITSNNKNIRNIAFNYPKTESNLVFLNTKELVSNQKNITVSTSIKNIAQKINAHNEVKWLWKWFLALAIVSLLLEILILKFFKQ